MYNDSHLRRNYNFLFSPTTNAIMGLTFAKYVIQPFFPSCSLPDSGVTLVAAATICKFKIQ